MSDALRLVLDLRACQAPGGGKERGASALSFAQAFVAVAGEHEVFVALDGSLSDSIPTLREALRGLVPPERMVVYGLPRPAAGASLSSPWRRHASAAVRRAFFEWLGADLMHESDWTAWPDGVQPALSPLQASRVVRAATYWPGDPPPGTLCDVLISSASGEGAASAALEAFAAAVVRRRSVKPLTALRPRLAFVSALPREESDVADHMGALLSALEQFYDVEVVVDEAQVDAVAGVTALPARSADWFDAHADEYDRVVYQVGRSGSHRHVIDLLGRDPGAVIFEEFFLADAVEECGRTRGAEGEFERALYRSHGYGALRTLHSEGRAAAGATYPCSGDLVRAADGVIVRTESAARLVEQWYGAAPWGDLAVVPAAAHGPEPVAVTYREVLERFAVRSPGAVYRRLVEALTTVPPRLSPSRDDLLEVAQSISESRPRLELRQLLVDVSELVVNDYRTGVQRVSRAILRGLIEDPPAGFRVEPVYGTPEGLRYARRYASILLGLPAPVAEDALVEGRPRDHFLGLDLAYGMVRSASGQIVALRDRGVRVDFVVYDMLPVLHPEWFPPQIPAPHCEWLQTVAALADGLVCISETVADELFAWLDEECPQRVRPLEVGSFGLGADVAASAPTTGGSRERANALAFVSARPTFMMVGTVEPRKGHAQTLAAFERLWASGVDCGLVIVGKEGWGVKELVTSLRVHPERGGRLLWLDAASDDVLLSLYGSATALLAASEGEGFGLPLVEAAQHGMPVVARDLPVFREVAGEHAHYFSGDRPTDLAAAIEDWLALDVKGEAPPSAGMPWLTWADSTTQLLDCIVRGGWRSSWPRTPASEPRS